MALRVMLKALLEKVVRVPGAVPLVSSANNIRAVSQIPGPDTIKSISGTTI